jgi:hypothetical protein
MVMFNPSGVDKVGGLVSVGFTYGYSWGGPLRGHIDLTFYPLNFCVAHPSCAFRLTPRAIHGSLCESAEAGGGKRARAA